MKFDHQERIYVEAAIGYNPDTGLDVAPRNSQWTPTSV